MGCKISKKSEPIEAAIQDIPSLRKPEQNMEDSDQAFAYQPKQNDPLPRPVEKSREIITKENDITIKVNTYYFLQFCYYTFFSMKFFMIILFFLLLL